MDNLRAKYHELGKEISLNLQKIGIDKLNLRLEEIENLQADPNFWQDQLSAQNLTKEASKISARIKPWQDLYNSVSENIELVELGDDSIRHNLEESYDRLIKNYNLLKKELLFSGPYDDHDVILSIHAGAGGIDAMDWALMLERMYLRYCEGKKNLKTEILDRSAGEEAGIKSVSIEISGPMAYGKLKSENGVHRLVRLSPFNADNLRQTSFARVEIIPKIDQPEELEIDEKDLKIDVYRAGGHGGQSVNTTDSAVRITHIPTGITVAIQNERSQLQNKETAITILRSKLAQLQLEQHKETIAEIKGPNEQAAWGNQIRNYVLHPYSLVKDTRTKFETSNVTGVLDGDLDQFIEAFLNFH